MHIYDRSIGELNADGSTKIEAEVCALSGVDVSDEHQSKFRLDDTHFVRVCSQLAPRFTEEVRAALIASYAPKSKPTKSEKEVLNAN